MGGQRAARVRRVPARVVALPSDLRRHARSPGAAGAAAKLGRRQAQLHCALARAALGGCNRGFARRPRPRSPGGGAAADPGTGRGGATLRGRNGANAARPGAARARRRPLPAEWAHRGARGPRDAAGARRRPSRRARLRGAELAPGRLRARQELYEAGAHGAERRQRGTGRVAAFVARPQGGADAPGRPSLARARPVRLSPGPAPPGRLRHPRPPRAQAPPSGRGRVPRAELAAGRGGDRRNRRCSLCRCDRGRVRGRRRAPDRHQGAANARASRRARRLAGCSDRGPTLFRAGRRTRRGAAR